jgi:hypothetical protein
MVSATSSVGGIWSSVSPELGETVILERFMQVCRQCEAGHAVLRSPPPRCSLLTFSFETS